MRKRHLFYWVDTLGQDVSFACRLIRRSPILSATILATLTTGIALNVSVFSLVNSFLLRPWTRIEPETFVSVFPRYSGDYDLRYSDGGMSQPDYARLRDSAGSLSALSAFRLLNVTLSGPESGNMFTLPSYGGNRDGVGWKLLGFQDAHVFYPPFGYYDRDYAGFAVDPQIK